MPPEDAILQIVTQHQLKETLSYSQKVVMGQGPSPAQARPGARGFWRALGLTFGKGPSLGPARALAQKPGGFEGLLKCDFL